VRIAMLLRKLDRRTVASVVEVPINDAQERFLRGMPGTVSGRGRFKDIVIEYYSYLFSWFCTANPPGGAPPDYMVYSYAEDLLKKAYPPPREGAESACADALVGTNGGLPGVIEAITREFRDLQVQAYVRRAFTEYLDDYCHLHDCSRYDARCQLMRDFFVYCADELPQTVRTDQPDRYATRCETIIQAYAEGRSAALSRLLAG